MSSCNLYKDTYITIRRKGNIFYGPIKLFYQTFNEENIQVFYNGDWYSAKIIGEPNERKMISLNNDIIGSFDLCIKTNNGDKFVKDLNFNDIIEINKIPIDKIDSSQQGVNISSIEITDIESDWLFGVEFINSDNRYYTLTNGMIIASK